MIWTFSENWRKIRDLALQWRWGDFIVASSFYKFTLELKE
jgi:hypothetical protein